MKKITGWIALTVTAYLVALLALLPASYVINDLVPQLGIKLDSKLALTGISGTIWNGEVEQLHYQGKKIGKATWGLHPLSLLVGNLALNWQLKTQDGDLHGEATFDTSGQILLEDIKGQIPVEELTALLPFVPVVVNGAVTFDLSEVQIEGGKPKQATGEIHWNRAVIVAMQKVDFGDVTAILETRADTGNIEAKINNRQGALAVNATAILEASGKYQLAGELTASKQKNRALLNNFIMLGRPDQNGRLRFSQSGRFKR